jgi:DNA-binding beta-propeller fold protein YncE
MPLTEKQWTTFARDLQRALVRVEPDWIDSNAHDPGITVLEVLSYVITDLQHRRAVLDDRARGLARTVAERAIALASADDANDDCGPGLQRVNYAYGMVLGVDDFNAEQDYFRSRLQQHNRLLHGTGTAVGLGVSVEHGPGASRITIAPGLALDPAGNEILVAQSVCVALPAQGTQLFVLLRYAERPCRPAPFAATAPVDASDGGTVMQPTRIVETFGVGLEATPAADAVAIARLRQVRGRWRVDSRFEAVRLGER